MKKFFLILCTVFLFAGCSDNNGSSLSEETTNSLITETSENEYEIIAEEQYYRVKRSDGAYSYEILDSGGNIVRSDDSYTKEPHISMLNEKTVKVSYQAGTGLSTRWTFYYNTVSNEFSPIYYSVFDESGGNVVYRSGSGIVISDIFDKTKYYKEIKKFKYPLSETVEPFISAEIDDGGDMIKISYLTGDDFEEVTEYFDISDNGWKGAYKAAFETFRQSGDYTKSSMFSLCDINGDDIPEFFISEDFCHAAGVHIYTFDGELTELGEFGSNGEDCIWRFMNGDTIYGVQHYTHNVDSLMSTICQYRDGTITPIAEIGYLSAFYFTNDYIYYYDNKKTICRMDYRGENIEEIVRLDSIEEFAVHDGKIWYKYTVNKNGRFIPKTAVYNIEPKESVDLMVNFSHYCDFRFNGRYMYCIDSEYRLLRINTDDYTVEVVCENADCFDFCGKYIIYACNSSDNRPPRKLRCTV